MPLIDLTGQVFSDWTVVERASNTPKQARWLCRCVCGAKRTVQGSSLRCGDSTNCGCRRSPNLTGQVFGYWTVIREANNDEKRHHKDRQWLCRCACGTERVQEANRLRAGKTTSCGRRGRHGSGWFDLNGYRVISLPDHPNARKNGAVFEHVAVMGEVLGRPLLPGENVHHRNGVRYDNRPENLELWVVWQPPGQRVEDLVAWAHEVLARYDCADSKA